MSELPENIWKLVQEGDKKSFEQIYLRLYKPLCMFACNIIKDRELSEELVNDLFLKIWTNREFIIINGSVKGYLFQAVHNLSLNMIKQMSTNKAEILSRVTETKWKFIEETYMINQFLLENIMAEETENRIRHIVDNLPDQCREIFILSRFQGQTNQEISKQLDLAENTVRVQIFRALHKIKESLENLG